MTVSYALDQLFAIYELVTVLSNSITAKPSETPLPHKRTYVQVFKRPSSRLDKPNCFVIYEVILVFRCFDYNNL
jgi:hypothetical protein